MHNEMASFRSNNFMTALPAAGGFYLISGPLKRLVGNCDDPAKHGQLVN